MSVKSKCRTSLWTIIDANEFRNKKKNSLLVSISITADEAKKRIEIAEKKIAN